MLNFEILPSRLISSCALAFLAGLPTLAQPYAEQGYLTFDLKPMGSIDRPLILRTFVPSLNLSLMKFSGIMQKVSNRLNTAPVAERESSSRYEPIDGLPAALAVNLGKELVLRMGYYGVPFALCLDRWFLDMKNYWGDRQSGRRKGFGYVPRLYGFVFYKALGDHPLSIDGKSLSSRGVPDYQGYSLDSDRLPVYDYRIGSNEISVKIRPGPATQTLKLEFSSGDKKPLSFESLNTPVEVIEREPGKLGILLRPNAGDRFSSDEKKEVIEKPTAEIGERLYTSLGCIACHSIDGGKNHGPTLKGVFGAKKRILALAQPLKIDDSYLRESIENPWQRRSRGISLG